MIEANGEGLNLYKGIIILVHSQLLKNVLCLLYMFLGSHMLREIPLIGPSPTAG